MMDKVTPLGDPGQDWGGFRLGISNGLAWAKVAGKSEAERHLAEGMVKLLKETEQRTVEEVRVAATALTGMSADINEALYGLLATTTTGRALDVVR